ncbi:hypothetical protein AB0937_19075 [Streptomyces sp. NPDC047880]|uniref:hypothetical protein n=1 Tax=Streptomyces sp. NPDC047880 TaxID=3155626 RepID=UPI0034517297
MPTLILLGGAGGVLRGLLDVYTRFLDWHTDRRGHRRLPSGQEGGPPRFQQYFDPVGDSVAAVVHSAMGAGAAVLLGTTGQISGAYAALVVGISAPVILTQLGRVQSVNDALTGGPQPETGVGVQAVPEPAPQATAAAAPSPVPVALSGPAVARPVSGESDGTAGETGNAPPHTAHSNGRPADAAGSPARERHGRETPPLPPRPAVGEEGTG